MGGMSAIHYTTAYFVDATPESMARKKVEIIEKRNVVKMKVIERAAGTTMKQMLQKSDPPP